MGIRILASVIALFAALQAEAAALPAVPPLELADLRLRVPAPTAKAAAASTDLRNQDDRQLVNRSRWLNAHQALAPEQRWVF